MQAIHPAAGIIGDEAHPKRVLYITRGVLKAGSEPTQGARMWPTGRIILISAIVGIRPECAINLITAAASAAPVYVPSVRQTAAVPSGSRTSIPGKSQQIAITKALTISLPPPNWHAPFQRSILDRVVMRRRHASKSLLFSLHGPDAMYSRKRSAKPPAGRIGH